MFIYVVLYLFVWSYFKIVFQVVAHSGMLQAIYVEDDTSNITSATPQYGRIEL